MDLFTFDHVDYAAGLVRRGSDGKIWREAVATNGATALTPYRLQWEETGMKALALADNTHRYRVGVPAAAVASGEVGWFQTGGFVDDMITASLSVSVGHAFYIYDGAVADAGSDFSGATSQFGICRTVSTSSTTQDVMLIDEIILATT